MDMQTLGDSTSYCWWRNCKGTEAGQNRIPAELRAKRQCRGSRLLGWKWMGLRSHQTLTTKPVNAAAQSHGHLCVPLHLLPTQPDACPVPGTPWEKDVPKPH